MLHAYFRLVLVGIFLSYAAAANGQEFSRLNAFCYQVLSGHEETLDQQEEAKTIVQCFDSILDQCALSSGFTICITELNSETLDALDIAHASINQTRQTLVPDKKESWSNIATSLKKIRETGDQSADIQIALLRELFFVAMQISELR